MNILPPAQGGLGGRRAQAFADKISGATQELGQSIRSRREREMAQQMMNEENKGLLKNFGVDLSGVSDPKQRQQIVGELLQGQRERGLQEFKNEQSLNDPRVNDIRDLFGEDAANLYKAAPEGGKTEILKNLLDSLQRNENFSEKFKKPAEEFIGEDELSEEIPKKNKKESLNQQVKNAIAQQDKFTTPKDREKRKSERYKVGFPIWQESQNKLKKAASDSMRFDILEDLNKSSKLPSTFDRLNVDKEGNLKFPFAATPEAERYVKTLNEFSEGAKDSYGSRVTNFDLIQYFKRFPNLLNSQEGRKQILQQMKIVNEINSLYYKNLQNVYKEAGGVRNVDPDIAQDLAEQMTAPKTEKLLNKFKDIGQFSSLPAASEFKGRKMRDKETGEVFISNGSSWDPVE